MLEAAEKLPPAYLFTPSNDEAEASHRIAQSCSDGSAKLTVLRDMEFHAEHVFHGREDHLALRQKCEITNEHKIPEQKGQLRCQWSVRPSISILWQCLHGGHHSWRYRKDWL